MAPPPKISGPAWTITSRCTTMPSLLLLSRLAVIWLNFPGLYCRSFQFNQLFLNRIYIISGLALSVFMFCLVTFISLQLSEDNLVYQSRDAGMYATIYGPYFQNLFIKTSTSITVLMALYRHAAVARPISAKQYLTLWNTLMAIAFCFIFWTLALLPFLWSWKVKTVNCGPGNSIIVLDTGPFEENEIFKQFFTHSWSIIGFIIPVLILAYCNIKLIRSLHTSLKRSLTGSHAQSARQRHRQIAQRRMNITLITIVASFFILVFPSELFQYYLEFSNTPQNNEAMKMLVLTCNFLQAVNMSINFLLYCLVNSNFRKSLRALLPCFRKRKNAQEYSSINSTVRGNTEIIPLDWDQFFSDILPDIKKVSSDIQFSLGCLASCLSNLHSQKKQITHCISSSQSALISVEIQLSGLLRIEDTFVMKLSQRLIFRGFCVEVSISACASHVMPLNQHGTTLAVTSAVQLAGCFWECS